MTNVVDFTSLRPHFGDVRASFEQLCAVLAHRDDTRLNDPAWTFVRNGRPDGGVECYWRHTSGDVHAVQAKFLRAALNKAQWSELDESMESALEKYGQLRSITICLPQDLPHSPRKGIKTARQKWDDWILKWIRRAAVQKRPLTIAYCGEHELVSQLITVKNRGVLQFFFNRKILSPNAVTAHVDEQLARAGTRFQPELHVTNPLEGLFDMLSFGRSVRKLLTKEFADIQRLLHQGVGRGLEFTKEFRKARETLLQRLSTVRQDLDVPTADFTDNYRDVSESLRDLLNILYHDDPDRRESGTTDVPGDDQGRHRWDRSRDLRSELGATADSLDEGIVSRFASAKDARAAVISGTGGCGKTHLICHAAKNAVVDGRPVVLALGQQLHVDRLWQDITPLVGSFADSSEFLDTLDVAGEIAECRTLLLIDALNEADENAKWPAELRALLTAIERYPHVAVVLTFRDAYRDIILPRTDPALKNLPQYEHYGFAENAADAAAKYFDHYHILMPDVPALHPEFQNPLFLSVFCRAITRGPDPNHERQAVPFVGGATTFTKVFDLFVHHLQDDLDRRFGLDHDLSAAPLLSAISALSVEMARSPNLEIRLSVCKQILNAHVYHRNPIPNIVGVLESAGLLYRVPRRTPTGGFEEFIQFSYDRMGAHFVMQELLRPFSTAADATALLTSGSHFAPATSTSMQTGRLASLADALMMQWVDRFAVDLFDFLPKLTETLFWRSSYLRALAVAAGSTLGPHMEKWLTACLSSPQNSWNDAVEYVDPLLQRVSNPRVVNLLHKLFSAQSLPDRDRWWTTHISRGHPQQIGGALVAWPLSSKVGPLSQEMSLCYATAVAWFSTGTVREARARAIKAMAAVLDSNLAAAAPLLRRFIHVNDPFVVQAVGMAVYGACLRATDSEALVVLGQMVLEFKRDGWWPVDLLTRHALAGIVEIAEHRVPRSQLELGQVRPPYTSTWPELLPSWDEIEEQVRREREQNRYSFSTIVSSSYPVSAMDSGRLYGDFGRYVVSSACHKFFPPNGHDRPALAPPFAPDAPHRFIIQRVQQLGWTSQRFEEFDTSVSENSRHKNVRERIGKKYQWIALSEFLARAADRFPIFEGYSGDGSPGPYSYPRQLLYEFNFDTSLLTVLRREERQEAGSPWWATRSSDSYWTETRDVWLLNAAGVPDPRPYIIQREPGSSRDLAMLEGFLTWSEDDPDAPAGWDCTRRTIGLHVACYAVHAVDFGPFRDWMLHTTADNQELPDTRDLGDSWFGELYWSRSAQHMLQQADQGDDWSRPDQWQQRRIALLQTAYRYYNESDPTLGSSLYALIPSPWVVHSLELRTGPSEFTFNDGGGTKMCFNPSVVTAGPDAVFCDAKALVQAVDRQGLRLIWCVTGEKLVLGGSPSTDAPIWPWIQGLYWWDGELVHGSHRFEFDEDFRVGRPRKYPTRPNETL